MLKRPESLVRTPILQTVSYIWLAWLAQTTRSRYLRGTFLVVTFSLWGVATRRQWKWVRPHQTFESGLLMMQIVFFASYGVVYLLSFGDVISPTAEHTLYTLMDVSTKLFHSAAIVVIRRGSEFQFFCTSLKNYLELMTNMRSLVRAQFDLVIHCRWTPLPDPWSGLGSPTQR